MYPVVGVVGAGSADVDLVLVTSMKPPPSKVVVDGMAASEDPRETVIRDDVELNSGNFEVAEGIFVVLRLVSEFTGTDVAVLITATVVVFVELGDGAVVVLEAATFVVVELNAEMAVTVTVVAVVVTRTVVSLVTGALLSVRDANVELGEVPAEVREQSAESIAELREASGMVFVTEVEMVPVKNVGTAISLESPLPDPVPAFRIRSISCNSSNRICKSRSLSSLFGTVIIVDCLFTISVVFGHTYCWNIPSFETSTTAESTSRLATSTCRFGIRPPNTSCSYPKRHEKERVETRSLQL